MLGNSDLHTGSVVMAELELTPFDTWDGEHISHIVLCNTHMYELETEPIYAMSYPEVCERHNYPPQNFCDWCDRDGAND